MDLERLLENVTNPFLGNLYGKSRERASLAASLANAIGHRQVAGISSTTQLGQEAMRRKGLENITGMKESGDTLRQQLLNEAQKEITRMQQSGQNWRTKYGADVGLEGTKYSVDDTGRRFKSQLGEIGRQFDITTSVANRPARPGVSAYDAVDMVLGSQSGGMSPTAQLEESERSKPMKRNAWIPETFDEYASGSW